MGLHAQIFLLVGARWGCGEVRIVGPFGGFCQGFERDLSARKPFLFSVLVSGVPKVA